MLSVACCVDEGANEAKAKEKADLEKKFYLDGAEDITAALNWNKDAEPEASDEPPPPPDNRPLSEILADNAAAKQAEFEDKYLKNRPVID